MRDLYVNNPVNQPRIKTDVFFSDYENECQYTGFLDKAFRYIRDFRLADPVLWRRFVQQFREDADANGAWRGEYWGKMMRGASMVWAYTRDEELYSVLVQTVHDMIDSANEEGRISSYPLHMEFDGWDIWCRKYVMLGMQYFLEVCPDEALKAEMIASMKKQADYIIARIGSSKEGKKPIVKATRHWRGLNSSSILEPIVRLYSLTGEQAYLDFASHIVGTGATDVVNIFDLAYENETAPYQYPVTKAYEMTSCFEGLLEYYRITGEEKYKTAVVNYANKILETDFTVIGSCGCTHELFDHSTVRQANTNNDTVMQETCVTVTLMKFFLQVHLLTGDPKFMDAFEVALYNAYLGSINTEKVIEPTLAATYPDLHLEPLPFDSYSPLTAGTRGKRIGGFCIMSDNHYYGCCACIGAAGIGLVPRAQLLATKTGFAMNLYLAGSVKTVTPEGQTLLLRTETDYPRTGNIRITVELERPECFELKLRIPAWSVGTGLQFNCEATAKIADGYASVTREWKTDDAISLLLDMRTRAIRPLPYVKELLVNKVIWGVNTVIPLISKEDPTAPYHMALLRGPVTLAQENRLGYSVDDPVEIAVDENGYVDAVLSDSPKAPYETILEVTVPLTDGTRMTLTDYSSAGKLWTEESKMAAWILTKNA
ncbi:MAG: glycoside hydrolase family 127 protein [Clostridia bacterium]|nr:glycoside hydrolase family 127 protein [Clostridia bacterium]